MNVLPSHPKYIGERYFADARRLHCGAAYTAWYAQPRGEVFGRYAERYKRVVALAHERDMPACVQLQSTLANLVDLDAAEAQHAVDNTPFTFGASNVGGNTVCFGSFASEAWKRLLQEFTTFFVRECGFDWVVFEEPMYAVDVPGTSDRFYDVFRAKYPGEPYPTRNEETPAYLKVQQLKLEVLAGFYRDLVDHAKSVGAKKCGVMPWFFVPIYENTPYENLATSCDIGRIIGLDNLDFVVVRMQPDNVFAGATADLPGGVGGRVYYTEVMAHSLGKPVICVNNAVNEHRRWFEFDAIPLDFFRASTLAAVAAAPNGMSHHWYVPRDLPHIEEHWSFLAKTNEALLKLGRPQCATAFVYSYRGLTHAAPYRHPEIHERFWAFAHDMLFEPGPLYPVGERTMPAGNIPFKVFYADSLATCLKSNPETRLLVMDEYMPLPDDEIAAVEGWLREAPAGKPRAVLAFASGYGYSADPAQAGDGELDRFAPAFLRLCGFDATKPARPRIVNRARRIAAAPGAGVPAQPLGQFESVLFRCLDATPAPETTTLLRVEPEGWPFLTRRGVGERGSAVFTLCSGLWPKAVPPISPIVRWILETIDARPLEIAPGPGVLWNITENDYLIATNPTDKATHMDIADYRARYWDVSAGRFLETTRVALEPYSFFLARRVRDGQSAPEVEGAKEEGA